MCQYPSHQNSVFIMSFIKNERKPTEAALGHIDPRDYNRKTDSDAHLDYLTRIIKLHKGLLETTFHSKMNTKNRPWRHKKHILIRRLIEAIDCRDCLSEVRTATHTHHSPITHRSTLTTGKTMHGGGMKEKESEISQHQGQLCLNYLNLIL